MPTTKRKHKPVGNVEQKQPTTGNATVNTIIRDVHGTLPFASYTSAVAVHTTLLSFTALYLPRTAFLSEITRPQWDLAKQTSRDKPQSPFLNQLTLSPVSTLAWICLGVLFVQIWWGGWMRTWYIGNIVHGSDEEKKMQRVAYDKQKFKHLKSATMLTLLASVVFHGLLVLLGAPLTNYCLSDHLHTRTYLLALLLALLTVPVPAYTLDAPSIFKSDSQSWERWLLWTRLFAERSVRNSIERALVYPVTGALTGCWIGAIPIALDWDRPWQAWPLTPAYGAICGYIVASLAAFTATAINIMAAEQLRAQATGTDTISKSKLKAKAI
ncbi:GPI biosynthesis protein family Pig-F domain containing protein [Amanita muscaria]